MAGKQLPGGSRIEQDLTAYEDLTDEELEKIMAGKMADPGAEPEEEEEEEAEADPEEEADAEDEDSEEEEDEAADEPDEDDAEPEAKDDPDGEEKPNPLEARLAQLERRLKIEALERQKETAARERAELLASKNAGRAGFLKQQLEKSGKAAAKPQGKPEDGDESEAQWDAPQEEVQAQDDAEQSPARDPRWDEDRQELIKIAVNDEGFKFAQERADELQELPDTFNSRLQELVAEATVPYREVFRTSSIKTVRKLARSLFSTAYATALIEHADEKTAGATTRKAESVAKSKRRKKKAAISKSGRGAKPKAKPSSYDDMSDEELEAEFKAEFGENYNARRDSLLS